jgi:hypothetical protein
MSPDMENVEFARNNEGFSDDLIKDYPNQKNWVVTIRFYSYLHYVEEELNKHGYNSRTHDDRKKNIRICKHIDNRARSIYRTLEDISRDARYECIEMNEEDVKKSGEKLEKGKNILGFMTNSSSDTKYST